VAARGRRRTFYPTFRDLAAGEARRLPKRPPATAVRRFRRGDGAQFLEVRLERPESDPRVVLVIAHDATDQVQARRELSETREALLKNEQLAMVGELASSVAHDLGNTLRGISARISVLAADEAIAQTKAEVIAGLRESVEAAIATIRDLHDVARMGRLDPGPVQLGSVIQRAAEILRLRQPHDAPRIEVNTAVARLPPVLGTVSELSHLFLSLFFNAREAMSKGGTINVVGTRSRDQVRVSVFDSGAGFSPEAQAHLFEPFFTTKGPGGTGLGLWLAQSTMRRFHGTIAVRNRRRGGAEIQLEFQIAGKRDARVTQGRARGRPREPGAPSS
jgi:signal transduction histidine kinase